MHSDEAWNEAQSLLRAPWKCQGHCGEMANIEYVKDRDIAAQVCPSRYVSRIIAYGKKPDQEWFREFVKASAPGLGAVEKADIRVASRYAWDLGLDDEDDELILKELYWTQNYRRTKSADPSRPALFLCANGDSFFVQALTSGESLCQTCRSKRSR